MFEHLNHRKRILDLEERFHKLERDFQALQLEWSNTLDKLNHIAGRMAKRAALQQEREDAMMGTPIQDTDENGSPRLLSPAAANAQRAVLARRHKLNNGGS